ncbi:hypothetical protein ACIQKB_04715 [Streptomyces sp. NPDC092046]|uniref:hypothetical protein n=1 Tax=Streptomyces sp. NPDC092046 TaxID=3366009 RepID=UPI003817EC8F
MQTDDARETRGTRTWVPPFLSTLVTLPLSFLALVYVMFSPMACDSCGQEESRRFTESFMPAFATFAVGLLVPLTLLVVGWALPRRVRHTPRRLVLAVCAPFSVFAVWLVFLALVDWP